MAIEKGQIDLARKSLKALTGKPARQRVTAKDFVAALIGEIQAKQRAGFSLPEICDQVNDSLPADQKIRQTSFKTYVKQARDAAGIPPVRSRKPQRKGPSGGTLEDRVKQTPRTAGGDPEKNATVNTQGDFRDMGGDL